MKTYSDFYVEQSVLGSIMLLSSDAENSEMAMDAIEGLVSDDFTSAAHRIVFNSIKRLNHVNAKIDLLTVTADLEQTGEIKLTGGFSYLG